MNSDPILILGASGRVGKKITQLALTDGHFVTAVVRDPQKLHLNHPNLTIVKGDATDAATIQQALASNPAAILSALGTDGGTTLTDSMPKLILAMKQQQVSRILTIGTAGILQSRIQPELLRYQSSESKRTLTRAAEEHHRTYLMLADSGLEWTVVCPTYLPDGEATGHYRVERDFLPEGGTQISVGDTALFAYRQIFSHEYLTARAGIAY